MDTFCCCGELRTVQSGACMLLYLDNLIAETRLNGIFYSLLLWFQNATTNKGGCSPDSLGSEHGATGIRHSTVSRCGGLFVTFPLFCSITHQKGANTRMRQESRK